MRFPNSPITEAILDITVNVNDNFDHIKLLDIHEEIKEFFPNRQQRMAFKGGIEFNLENPDAIRAFIEKIKPNLKRPKFVESVE